MFVVSSRFLSDVFVAFWANTDPHNVDCHAGGLMKNA
jgi:hypothetical protein